MIRRSHSRVRARRFARSASLPIREVVAEALRLIQLSPDFKAGFEQSAIVVRWQLKSWCENVIQSLVTQLRKEGSLTSLTSSEILQLEEDATLLLTQQSYKLLLGALF